jgi:hypothetical protein
MKRLARRRDGGLIRTGPFRRRGRSSAGRRTLPDEQSTYIILLGEKEQEKSYGFETAGKMTGTVCRKPGIVKRKR